MQYRTLTALIDMTDPDVGQLSADGQPPYASLLKNVENLLYVIKVGTYGEFLKFAQKNRLRKLIIPYPNYPKYAPTSCPINLWALGQLAS